MDKALEARNVSWIGMISSLSPEITHHLKSRAQGRFLDLLPSPRSAAPVDRTLDQSLQMAENLLSVIDAIIRGGSMGRPPQLVPAMVERFADLWEILSAPEPEENLYGGNMGPSPKQSILDHWLPLLLNFITLHAQTFDTSKPSNETRAKALIVCAGLIQDLDILHGPGVDTRALSGRIFDLACLFVDNLAEDLRAMCVRALRDTTSDTRIRYIFSFLPNASEHLMLCHRDRTPGAAAGAAGAQAMGANRASAGPGTPTGGVAGGGGYFSTSAPGMGTPDPYARPQERLSVFHFRRWELLNEPTPNVGENDTALSLGLFEARKLV